MESYIAVVASDLHLDEHAWADRRNINGDSIWSFEWITQFAIEKNLPLILAGDVLDKQLNNASLSRFLRTKLHGLSQAGIKVYFIQGQHDLQPFPWLTSLGDTCVHINQLDQAVKLEAPGGTVNLYGIDWTPANGMADALGRIPKCTDILVMHQVTLQFMQELGEVKIYELDLANVPHAKLLVIGDFHRHRILPLTGATGQEMTVLSPGSTNIRSIDEPSDKYIFLIKDDLTFERVEIPTRPKHEITIFREDDLEDVICEALDALEKWRTDLLGKGVPASIAKPLLRVKFDPTIPLIYKRIANLIGDAAHFFPAYISSEKTSRSSEEISECDKAMAAIGPAAGLPFLVDKTKDPELFEFLQRLLTEEKVEQVLQSERIKYIEGQK